MEPVSVPMSVQPQARAEEEADSEHYSRRTRRMRCVRWRLHELSPKTLRAFRSGFLVHRLPLGKARVILPPVEQSQNIRLLAKTLLREVRVKRSQEVRRLVNLQRRSKRPW